MGLQAGRIWLAVGFMAAATFSFAEEIRDYYAEPGLNPFKETINQNFNEHIDPFSGTLQLKYTDIHVPGNGGMDININRVYTSLQTNEYPKRTSYGVGWVMHFGRIVAPKDDQQKICNQDTYQVNTADNPSLEHPDGARELLVLNSVLGDGSLITRSNWRADCTAGDPGMVVSSPDGTKYTMDHFDFFEGEPSWFTTRIEDVNGNWISIEYESADNGASYIKNIYRSEEGESEPVVTYEYQVTEDGLRLLDTITANGQVWTYEYEEIPGYMFPAHHLVRVTRPDNKYWEYTYFGVAPDPDPDDELPEDGVGSHSLQKVKYPDGAEIDYTYQFVRFDHGSSLRTTAIETKHVSGRDIASGDWTYVFEPHSVPMEGETLRYDKTTITSPDDVTEYYHYGKDYRWVSVDQYHFIKPSWVGLLAKELTYDKRGNLLFSKFLNWDTRKISNESMIHGSPYRTWWTEFATFAPFLVSEGHGYDSEAEREFGANGDGTVTVSRITKYSGHDDFGNPTVVREFNNYSRDDEYRTTTYEYSNDTAKWILGKVTSEESTMDGDTSLTTRAFDELGQLKQETTNGVDTNYEYTSTGDVESVTDANGNTTYFSDYKRGIAQQENRPENVSIGRNINDTGTVSSITDGRGITTSFSYDDLNRLTGIDFPIYDDVSISYSSFYRTLTRGGFKQVDEFDSLGRLIKTTRSDTQTGEAISQRTELDALGRKVYESDPYGEVESGGISYDYDALGRVIKKANSDGTYVSKSYDDEITEVVDERGNVTTYRNRNIGLDDSSLLRVEQPESVTTKFERNLLNQPYEIWQYGDSGRVRREYKYNEKYFLESKNDPEIGTTHYTYDLVGNLKSSQVEESGTTTYEYDDLDRLTFVDYPGSTVDTDFSYDDNGNLTGLIAGESSWSYQYDNNNNLTDETLTINSGISRSYAFHYDYNTLDFLAGITYPNSLYIDYAPNNLGRPTKAGSYAENVIYHPSGQIESFTYGNGKVAQFTLNQRLFPETVSVDGLVDLTYSYDDTGNVTSIIDAINSSQNVLMDQAGSYDGINRLRQVSGPWGTLDYSYNTFGDIQTRSLDGTSSNYFYRNAKLKQLRNSAELKFMDFDPLGNVTRKSQYDLNSSGYVSSHDAKSYRYDHASRLVAAITGGSTKNYFYDGNGHRYLERIKGSYQNSFSVYTQAGTLLFEEEFAECSTKSYIRLGDLLVAQSVDQEMDPELDADADSISDCLETRLGLDPNDPQDATLDSDGDGLTNLEEVAQGTLLFSVDTDGDGVSDGDEVALQETDPLLADTDDDGINDSDETAAGSNLLLYDSDHDGVNDGDEQAFGLNALDPDDGRLDLDEDGYSNRQESLTSSDLSSVSGFPSDGSLAWYADTGGAIDKALSLDADGNLYVGARNGYLHAFHPDGSEKWRFQTGDEVLSTPVIGLDGTIYVGSDDGKLYAVNPDGTEKWNFQTYGNIQTSPSIGTDGTIYVASYDGDLYAINEDGTLRWNYSTHPQNYVGAGFLSSPAVGADGTIYVGGWRVILDLPAPFMMAFTPDGDLKWQYGTDGPVDSSPAIGRNGDIYFYADDGFLYALTKEGELKWKYDTGSETSSSNWWSPVVGQNDTVYAGTAHGELIALDRAGQLLWEYDPLGTPFTPVIAEDGTVYFGTANGFLYALNPDGNLKWEYTDAYLLLSPPAIDIDGTVYIGDRNGRVQSFVNDNGGLASTPWPKFARDGFGSGNLCRSANSVYSPQVDSDSDGIPDCSEYVFGLDPNDGADAVLDTDGDTISNLDEYIAGTSLTEADTDGDGINDNNEALFASNAKLPDSDGDGILDGDEDYDFDGVSNAMEVIAGTDPYQSEAFLATGINLFHYPFAIPDGLTAFQLLDNLGGYGVISKIEKYDSSSNSFVSAEYVDGVAEGQDFAIQSGEGYVVHAQQSSQYAFEGEVVCPTANLEQGINLIGFSCISGEFSAFDLLSHLGGESVVSSVQRYNRGTGRYESATWMDGAPVGVDFPVNNNEAYIVHAQTATSVASPAEHTDFSIDSHTDGQAVEGLPVNVDGEFLALVTISGTVGTDTVSVEVNGEPANVSDGTFTIDLPLEGGTRSVEVAVTNLDNLVTRSTITLDVEQPWTLEVKSHVDGQITYQSNPMVFGAVHESIDQIRVNGRPAVLESGSFRFGYLCENTGQESSPHCDYASYDDRLELDEGQHVLTVEAFRDGELLDSREIDLEVRRLAIATANPGLVSEALDDVAFPQSRIGEVAVYEAGNTGTFGHQLEIQATASDPSPGVAGNRLQTSIDVEVLNGMSGAYDATVELVFRDGDDAALYSADFLVSYDVPVSTVPPEFTVDSPMENADIYYSTGLVSGHYSASVDEIRVNGEVPEHFEGGIYSHPVDLTPGTLQVEAIGENPSLTRVKSVNFNTHAYDVMLAPGEIFTNEPIHTENFPASRVISYLTASDIVFQGAPAFVQRHNASVDLEVGETSPYKTLGHQFGIELQAAQGNPIVSGIYDFTVDWAPEIMGGFDPYMEIPVRLTVVESRDPPDIQLYSHTDGETVPSTTTGVAVRVSNDSSAQVVINGVQAQMEEIRNLPYTDHTYTAVLELNEGPNDIHVEVESLNGLTASETYTLNVVSQPVPTLDVTSHDEQEVISVDPVDIVAESGSETPGLTMYLNGEAQPSPVGEGTVYTWESTLLQEGDNLLEFYAPGYLDPIATRTVVLTPPPAPVITVTSHTEGEVVTQSPIVLTATVVNPVESLTIDGIEMPLEGSGFTMEHLDLFEGDNVIEITAKGPGAHAETTTRTLNLFYQSSELPREVLVASSGKTYFRHEFTTTTDLFNSAWQVFYSFGEGRPDEQYSYWSSIEKLPDNRIVATLELNISDDAEPGIYNFPVIMEFMDADSNLRFREIVMVDLTVTDENRLIPGSAILRSESITLEPTVFDAVSSVQLVPDALPDGIGIQYYRSSQDWNEDLWNIQFEISADTDVTPGNYTVPVSYNFLDSDSTVIHTEVRNINIEVVLPEAGPPTVQVNSHNNGETVTTPIVTISGSVADANAMVTVNGQAAVVTPAAGNEGTFSADITLEEGSNLVTVVATGEGQLTSTDQVTVNLSSQSSGGDLVIPVGETTRTSESFPMSESDFYAVAGLDLNYSGSADAINNLTFSNLSLTPVASELTWILEYDVSVNSAAGPGVYDLSITYTFNDSNQAMVVEETRELSVEVTE